MCALELSNGTTLEVTPEHRFSSNGEWTPIEELNVNDTLQLKDNSIAVIDNKIIFPTFVEVYNLEIEDNENYYVTEEGVLVHNGCKPRKPSDSNKNIDHSKTVVNADGSVSYTDLDGNTVLYNSNGYPDFSPYKMTQADDVAGMTGVYSHDAALANAKVGFKSTPEGYVWHHVEDGKTMQLIPQDIHQHFPHTGGASGLRNGTLP